tara:strand:+ start:2041 stop:2493 length:453 start_codon:yes stop_codon:yes gene_type:complete
MERIVKDKTYLAKPCDTILQGNVQSMRNIMISRLLILNNASGLAANQIRMPVRAFAMKIGRLNDNIVGFVNPEIKLLGDVITHTEKCLSLKGQHKVLRNTKCIIWDDASRHELRGWDSYVAQHEMDHLNGITIEYRERKEKDDRLDGRQM